MNIRKRKRKPVLEWQCLRCHADQVWLNRNRTKCQRCGAGREWLEQTPNAFARLIAKKTEPTP
jgi:hypothetical protein